MNELHEDLDRALRAVPLRDAPVERARRDGRRLRYRRRAGMVAGALAVVAVAAGIPTLAGNFTGPSSAVTSQDGGVVTDAPPANAKQTASGLVAGPNGAVAQGKLGALTWKGEVTKSSKEICYVEVFDGRSGAACSGPPSPTIPVSSGYAVLASGGGGNAVGVYFAVTAKDVTYLVVTFTDGQQLKLLPVTTAGNRYVAWASTSAMKVASITTYLGSPTVTNGQTRTAVPFNLDGSLYIGRWQKPGQATPARAQATLLHSGTAAEAYSVTAYEGPWGTCFVFDFSDYSGPPSVICSNNLGISSTQMMASSDYSNTGQDAVAGAAAADVALIKFTAPGGATSQAMPVKVGDERLFAAPIPTKAGSLAWVAYNAAGQEVGHGTYKL